MMETFLIKAQISAVLTEKLFCALLTPTIIAIVVTEFICMF